MTLIALLLVVFMVIAALMVVILPSILAAIAATSVVSLALALLFALLRAPDVALAEAAVSAGLSGVLLAMAARRVGLWGKTSKGSEQ